MKALFFDGNQKVRQCETKDRMITHEPRLEQGQEVLSIYAAGKAGKVAFDLS